MARTNTILNDNPGTGDTCTLKCLYISVHSLLQGLFVSAEHCSGTAYCAVAELPVRTASHTRCSRENGLDGCPVLYYIAVSEEKGSSKGPAFFGDYCLVSGNNSLVLTGPLSLASRCCGLLFYAFVQEGALLFGATQE